jgi:predicted RNA-binding Zn-ribbon protein involved in translation (DUF1610 family)
MPFIIWGSRGITSHLETGDFYCPRCNEQVEYHLKQVRPFFTIFFIPLFPIGSAQRYVECTRCSGQYLEEVLNLAPPTDADRLLGQYFNELQTGSSVETVQTKLEAGGMDTVTAKDIVGQMTQGQTWQCTGCGETYLKGVAKCLRCRR